MATFKIVAQVPTPMQPGGYDLEMEALEAIDAEIVEIAATSEAELTRRLWRSRRRARPFIGGARRRCGDGAGSSHDQGDHRQPGAVQGHLAGERRRGLGGRRSRDGAQHSRHELPGHLHRGGGRPHDDDDPGHLPPADHHGHDGTGVAVARGSAAAVAVPAAHGADAGIHRIWARAAGDGASGGGLRGAPAGLRPVHRGAGDERVRGRARGADGAAGEVGHRVHACAGNARGRAHADVPALSRHEAGSAVHQQRARADGGRSGAHPRAAGGLDSRGGVGRARKGAAGPGEPAAAHGQRHPDAARGVGVGANGAGIPTARGAGDRAGADGAVAQVLREPVRAGEDGPSPLAAVLDGARPGS